MNSKRISVTKFTTLVIILVFASLLFVACGGDSTTEATTEAITTEVQTTTEEITTEEPTTVAPTTEEPTTMAPTTEEPTTMAPTTEEPTTMAPTTEEPTTVAPTTEEPTTVADVMVSSISVMGAGGSSSISTFQGTLQMEAVVLPENADDDSVVWSVTNGTGEAMISASGLLTAISSGSVTVKATSVSTPTVYGTKVITISNQEVLVASITVTGAADATTISTFEGSLQMSAVVLPEDADDKTITWSVENGTGEATISETGLLTAVSNGTVTVKATSNSTPTVIGEEVITISNQEVLVSSITVTGAGDATTITTFQGTLQMSAAVLPANASDKSVVWSVANGTGQATISETGLLTAMSDGTVTVTATSVSTPSISGSLIITLSNQEVLVTSIEVTGTGDVEIIDVDGGTLQMLANVLPENAEDKTVVWTVTNGTGQALISETGLLTAVANGTVTVEATSVGTPSISGVLLITISNQVETAPLGSVDLGSAYEFTILAKTGISTTVNTSIIGNIGVSPIGASAITGFALTMDAGGEFSTSSMVTGNVYASDYAAPTPAMMTTAISDMEIAYTDAASRTADFTELHAGNLSGQTLVAGVYKYSTAVSIDSELILDGSETDVWIFQISGALTQAAAVQITLTGGAIAENVYWQVAGSVAIGANAHFEGTILSALEIAVGNSATVTGKLYSQTAVTLDANVVSPITPVEPDPVAVTSVTVTGAADATTIETFEGTLQMSAAVLPLDATDDSVVWSVTNGTGQATISETGLLTAVSNGTVTVEATSVSTPSVSGTVVITISNQEVAVSSITVSGEAAATTITTFEGTLQMEAAVLPENATDDSVIWSVADGTGQATISATGLLTAVADGTVTVTATSVSTPTIVGTAVITISNQEVLVTSVEVTGTGDATIIDVDAGTLQMLATVLPANATDDSVTWSVVNGTGEATISETGLLTAVADGTVTVTATSVSTPTISGSIVITISNQAVSTTLAVDLGTADTFTILGKTGISTTGTTSITGDIGVSPIDSTAITGFALTMDASGEFATSSLVVGNVYASDYAAPTPTFMTTVISDMETAYNDAASRTPDFTELYAGDISGQTLEAGVYKWTTGVSINTELTLNGSATDVFIFQISGSLTQAAAIQVTLSGGVLAENIFWQVSGDVTIGAGAHFEGTILAATGIAMGNNATLNGKLFSQTAVTLDANQIVG